MKPLKILGATLPVVGTAAAGSFPVANAIQNNPENFKNEPFKKVYKEGSWRPRFFDKSEFDYYGEGDYEKCGLSSHTARLWWLKEMEEENIKKVLNGENKDSDAIYMLIEFEKKGDWFNRNKRNSWYLFSHITHDPRYSNQDWINKLKKFINLDRKSATAEMFSILETEGRFLLDKEMVDTLIKEEWLFEPLNVETVMLGKCKRAVIKRTHI